MCLSGTRLSKRFLVIAFRSDRYEGAPPASLRDGRPAWTLGGVFECAVALPSEDCDRRKHASNSRRGSLRAFGGSPALNSAELRAELPGALALHLLDCLLRREVARGRICAA